MPSEKPSALPLRTYATTRLTDRPTGRAKQGWLHSCVCARVWFRNKTLLAKTPIYHRVLGDFCKALDEAADKGMSVNAPEWGLRYTIGMIGEVAFK